MTIFSGIPHESSRIKALTFSPSYYVNSTASFTSMCFIPALKAGSQTLKAMLRKTAAEKKEKIGTATSPSSFLHIGSPFETYMIQGPLEESWCERKRSNQNGVSYVTVHAKRWHESAKYFLQLALDYEYTKPS